MTGSARQRESSSFQTIGASMTTGAGVKIRQGDCFRLLAACFYEPEKELFLQEKLFENLAELLAEDGYHDAAYAALTMRSYLLKMDEDELRVEHARLFIGPFELAAAPYGSVYLDGNRMLMGDSTMAVQKIYRATGLSLEEPETPDHIALELEFMHYLSSGEGDCVARNDRNEARAFAATQSHFLLKYLAPWVPEFCAAIRKGTATGFYTSLADCLEGFIAVLAHRHKVTDFTSSAEDTHACRAAV